MNRDEDLQFIEESGVDENLSGSRPWKVIIADDEEEVHAVTRMVLEGFRFDGQGLDLLGAYSGAETQALLRLHPDTAVVLLDVVMEEDTSGLQVVKYIRNELKNSFVRIIMRTGQPGQAPERQVTMEYDINDYKEKTELTAQKLFTTMVASLRAYRDLRTIEHHKQGLAQLVAASAKLFEFRSLDEFVPAVVQQLATLLGSNQDQTGNQLDSLAAAHQTQAYQFLAGTGQFADRQPTADTAVSLPPEMLAQFQQAVAQKHSIFTENAYIGYVTPRNKTEYCFYLHSHAPFAQTEKQLLALFATNISVAFDNIALTDEIEATQKEVILTLGEVVETRSEETGYHVKRVSDYCYLLALKCGLGQEMAELGRLASPMHDVGKVGIPDAILNKPGKLTPAEFEVIKTHTSIGYNILKSSKQPILRTAALIALQHHEQWDGLGYPQGLRGEEIDILARIVKVVDVFDALSCKRIYKDPWDMDRILDMLRGNRGTQFDPELIDLLLENIADFLAIHDMYRDKQ